MDAQLEDATPGRKKQRVPVLIVGGGPIGLCLAADLGSRGISCLLIEQNDNRTRSARIMQISVGSMEVCRRFGIADDVRNLGLSARLSV